MKKLFAFLLSLLLISTTFGTYAETQVGSILFRNIPWFSDRSDVQNIMDNIEDIHQRYGSKDQAQVDTWYREWAAMAPDIYVPNGGAISTYGNLSVAGYRSNATLSFIFPIVDGKVLYSADKAQLYKARYEIVRSVDLLAAFDDLKVKLTSLYGPAKNMNYYNEACQMDNPEAWVWYGEDGSLVLLSLYYDLYKFAPSDLWITYAAPNTDELLANLDAQIKQEKLDAEEAERDRISNITDGLYNLNFFIFRSPISEAALCFFLHKQKSENGPARIS